MLLKQMRRSLDHIQELLLRQFTANIIGVCTIPISGLSAARTTSLPLTFPSTNDNTSVNFFQPNSASTTIYRSIPNEQIYFPYFDTRFKQPFHFPFYTSNFFYHSPNSNFYQASNQLNLYNSNQVNRTGALLSNENCKLININNFDWLDNSFLPNDLLSNNFLSNNFLSNNELSNHLVPNNSPISVSGARQFASNYFLPSKPFKDLNNYDAYFDKFKRDRHTRSYLNPDYNKYLLTKQPLNRENGRNYSNKYVLSEKDNTGHISRTTNYSNSITTNGSSLLTDGLASRLTESHCSPCLPIYTSDHLFFPNSPNNSLFPSFMSNSGQQATHFIKSQNVLLHQYLICQLQNFDKQQYQYYNNGFTSAFFDNDSESNKTDQCLTIYNLLCSFEVSVCVGSILLNLN